MSRFWKVILVIFLILILLVLGVVWAIESDKGQQFLTRKTTTYLSNKLKTKVEIDGIHFLLRKDGFINLDNVYIEDQNADTLIYAGSINVDFNNLPGIISGGDVQLDYVELNDAVIHLVKSPQTGEKNTSFLSDAFSKSNENLKTDSLKTKDQALIIPNKMVFNNVWFTQKDPSKGDSIDIKIPSGIVLGKSMDFKTLNIQLKSIDVTGADIQIYKYGGGQENPEFADKLFDEYLNIQSDEFKMTNGRFLIDSPDEPVKQDGSIDLKHLELNNINFDVDDLVAHTDSILLDIKQFSLSEPHGLDIKSFRGDLLLDNYHLQIDALDLVTANSHLKDRLVLKFDDISKFAQIETDVIFDVNLKDSKFATYDLALFVAGLKDMKMAELKPERMIRIDGQLKGRFNNLRGKNLIVQFGKDTKFVGDLDITGLPSIEESFIDLSANSFVTTPRDFKSLFPTTTLPEEIQTMGPIRFKGRVTGFLNDFVTNGKITSDFGRIDTDLNIKLIDDHIVYTGEITTKEFDLAKLIDDDRIGKVTLTTRVTGTDFSLNNLAASLDGKIHQLDYNGYSYKDLIVDGTFEDRYFKGKLSTSDSNADLDFNGEINFQAEKPIYDFKADVRNIDLQALNFSEKPLRISTLADVNLVGSDFLTDMKGVSFLEHLTFSTDSLSYTLDSLAFVGDLTTQNKSLRINSNVVDMEITGDYDLKTLSDDFKGALNYYFPVFKDEQLVTSPLKRDMNVDLKIHKNIGPLIAIFDPSINTNIVGNLKGTFNGLSKQMDLEGSFPEFSYNNYGIDTLFINSKSDQEDKLVLKSNFHSFLFNDLAFTNTQIEAVAKNDSLMVSLDIQESPVEKALSIKGLFNRTEDTLKISVTESNLTLGSKEWQIQENNSIKLFPGGVIADNFILKNEDQLISIASLNNGKDLNVFANQLVLDDLNQFLKNKDRLFYGTVGGDFVIRNVNKAPGIDGNLSIKDFVINESPVGDIDMIAQYDVATQTIIFEAELDDPDKDVKVQGRIDPQAKSEQLDLKVLVNNTNIDFAQEFTLGIFSNVKGKADGELNLTGTILKPVLLGSINVSKGGAKIDYLNTPFFFDQHQVFFRKDFIDFSDMELTDPEGNQATILDGAINHDHLKNLSLDFTIVTDNFKLLNTRLKDNSLFYGTAYGKIYAVLTGPFSDIEIYIAGQTNKGTNINIPLDGNTDVSTFDFVQFVDFSDTTKVNSQYQFKESNISLNFDIDVTPDALIRLIFDLRAGDIIQGTGTGNLNMELTKLGQFSMFGNYVVNDGKYLFTYSDLVNKEFIIEPGGSINWSGDPYDALLNINANYEKEVDYEAIKDDTLLDGFLSTKTKAIVDMNLTGSLLAPVITFDIRLPELGFNTTLEQLKDDPNLLNNQVLGLLILNQFLPVNENPTFTNTNPASRTISEFISTQVNRYVNDALKEFFPDVDFNVEWDNQSGIAGNEQKVGVNIGKLLLKDRLKVSVGGDFDIGGDNAETQNNNIAGAFLVEYSLAEDGRFKIKVFRRSEYDQFLNQDINKTGVGLFYREEYDSLSELIQRNEKKRTERRAKREKEKLKEDVDKITNSDN